MVESLQERYLNNQLSKIDEKLFMIYEALDQASLDSVSEILDKLEELPKGIEAIDQAIEKVGSNLNYLLGKVGKDAEKRLPQAIGEVTSLATILSTGFRQLPQIVKLNLRIKDLNQFPDGKSIDQVIQSKTNAKEIRNNFENQLKKAFTGQAKTGWGKFTASVGAFFKGKADRLKFYEKPGGLDYDKLINDIMGSTFKVVGNVYEMAKVLESTATAAANDASETSSADANKETGDKPTTVAGSEKKTPATTTSLADVGKKIDQKIDQLPPVNVSDQKKKETKEKLKTSTQTLLSMHQEMVDKLSSLKNTTKSEVEKILSPYKEEYIDSLSKLIKMERISNVEIVQKLYNAFDGQVNKTKINSTNITDDEITIGNLYVTITNKWASNALDAAIAEIEKPAKAGAKSKDGNEPIVKQNTSDDLSAAMTDIVDKLIQKNPQLEDLNDSEVFEKSFGISDLDSIRKVINGLTKNGLLKFENLIREKLRKRMLRENSNPRYLLVIENLIREELRKRIIQENARKNLRRNYRS